MISTRKQRAYISLLRQERNMDADQYLKFRQKHGLNELDRRDAGRIIGKLKQIRRLK